ncbi:MAG: bifunctional DNA-formamidopyrimidine glycosylase/DNA-(apurinic or apyrimidinic site) lyase [Candidatus Levybacteria bacterium]|nr:bifunctional DNA-formamidopyrimidine glycosylase/DNA-(apurinic or apyrimidinic site) lyase [Candidatus Levybacteria bacterium]
MPELPEVETIRLGLSKYLVGHKILNVDVKLKRIFSGDPKDIIGAKVESIERFGKGLVINLDNGFCIAVHIKLTGQIIYNDLAFIRNRNIHLSKDKVGQLPNKFTHVIFDLDKDAKLYYNDIRQFGWIKIVKANDLKNLAFFKDLGPEPIPSSGQSPLTLEQFENILSKSSIAVKVLIMDQRKLGGVGNIYANESLFLAGIDPRRKAKELSKNEAKKLFDAILTVLKKGLKYGGASELTFVNALGEEGGYQNHFLAYGKSNEKCSVCGATLQKIFLGGRGTFFCPKHQK